MLCPAASASATAVALLITLPASGTTSTSKRVVVAPGCGLPLVLSPGGGGGGSADPGPEPNAAADALLAGWHSEGKSRSKTACSASNVKACGRGRQAGRQAGERSRHVWAAGGVCYACERGLIDAAYVRPRDPLLLHTARCSLVSGTPT
jgi:hypothetical protein